MKATQKLHDLGQSLWLDNITRDLLTSGTLKRYIDELSVTGLTSNPTIFDHAIKNSSSYDVAIRKKLKEDLGDQACDVAILITPDEEVNNGLANRDEKPYIVEMNTIDDPALGDFTGTVERSGYRIEKLEMPGR